MKLNRRNFLKGLGAAAAAAIAGKVVVEKIEEEPGAFRSAAQKAYVTQTHQLINEWNGALVNKTEAGRMLSLPVEIDGKRFYLPFSPGAVGPCPMDSPIITVQTPSYRDRVFGGIDAYDVDSSGEWHVPDYEEDDDREEWPDA